MKIGIIGNGFVGRATQLLKNPLLNIIVYDKDDKLCDPIGTTLETLCLCDMIFISVPTPMNKDGSCHTNILESVIRDLKNMNYKGFIVNRCTVPVGFSDKHNCYFMPEFLTEKNYEWDFRNNNQWIFGLNKDSTLHKEFMENINELIGNAHTHGQIKNNNIVFVENSETEMIKLFRNNFLSTKIAFCNEIEEFCRKKDINYENVRKYATLDERIGVSHSYVPGHDGKRGFGGTCFPKDTNNLKHEMQKMGMKSYIIDATVERNENVDRKELDWENGRCII